MRSVVNEKRFVTHCAGQHFVRCRPHAAPLLFFPSLGETRRKLARRTTAHSGAVPRPRVPPGSFPLFASSSFLSLSVQCEARSPRLLGDVLPTPTLPAAARPRRRLAGPRWFFALFFPARGPLGRPGPPLPSAQPGSGAAPGGPRPGCPPRSPLPPRRAMASPGKPGGRALSSVAVLRPWPNSPWTWKGLKW